MIALRSAPTLADVPEVVVKTLSTAMGLCGLLFACLIVPSAHAQFTGADTLYTGGTLGFSYVQTPFPGYSGTFAADGPALGPGGVWDPGQTEAVGGGMTTLAADTVATAVYAITDNGDDTFDGAFLFIKTVGPLHPGTFGVDIAGGTAAFVFIDDAQAFTLPDTLDVSGLIQWFQDLPALHKLVSLSGSIAVSTVSADTLSGTFTGTTADIDNPFFLVNVSGGHFALSGAGVATATPGLPDAVALHASPNPFNPRTTLDFSLPQSQFVMVVVYDARGRRVRGLLDGRLEAGPRRVVWDGRDDADRPLPGGVYLARARGRGWEQVAKVTLLP